MLLKLYMCLLVVLFCIGDVYCSECSSYNVLNTRDRAQGFSGGPDKCDSSITHGWYRFMGDAGTAMPTSCVPMNHCGTDAPGWMQGSHPTQAEGVVTRTVCYHWSNNCCLWSNNIRVRNCGGFYVYELVKPTAGCDLRYCGNGIKACDSSPCRGGGTCRDDLSRYGYRCECVFGFTGKQCEKNLTTTVTCGDNYMQINITAIHFPYVDWRNLHLKDSSCRATTKTAYTMSLRTPLDGCGTTYQEKNNTIVFWNEVSSDGSGYGNGNQSTITRGKNIILPFFCEYKRKKLVSTSFSPAKKTVYASEGSYGNFSFTMDLYQTSQYQTPYSPFAYPVVVYPNQPLWVQYQVKNTTNDLVVLAETCHATTSNDPNSSPRYVFLQRGCVRDSTMVYSYDPYSRIQRFSIRSFRFVYSNTFLVYLHCELIVCHRNTTNSRCARGCISSRRRRETADMDGSKPYNLYAGPLKGPNTETGSDKQGGDELSLSTSATVGVVSAVAVVALLVATLLAVKMLRNRSRLHDQVATPAPPIAMDVTVNSYEQQVMENDDRMEIEI